MRFLIREVPLYRTTRFLSSMSLQQAHRAASIRYERFIRTGHTVIAMNISIKNSLVFSNKHAPSAGTPSKQRRGSGVSVRGLDEKVNRLVKAKALQSSDVFIRIHL